LGAGGWFWAGYHRQIGESEASLAEGNVCFRRGQYREAALAFRHGLVQAAYLPFLEHMRRELASGLAAASRREKAAELHRLADLIRIRYAIGQPAREEANWLIGKGREIWEAREFLKVHDSDGSQPDPDETVARDMLEILSLWTDLRVRMAPPANRDAARQESAGILAQAAREFGPIPSFSRASEACPDGTEQPGPAPVQPPRTAWYQYELGRSFLRSGDYQHASEHFRKGLELRPQDFWLNFYEGLCKYRTKKLEDAVHAFHICIVLSPDTAECYFNRGLAYQELGNLSQAMRDYDRALELNPNLGSAAMNRGVLQYRQGRLNEAAASLEQAMKSGTLDAAARSEIQYTQALIELASGRRAEALDHLRMAADVGHERARSLHQRLQSDR